MATITKSKGIPTIDVALVVIETATGSFALDTADKIGVNPVIDSQDAVQLIIKGVLKAQKPSVKTLTGHTIVLRDNVFTPDLVVAMQGGTAVYDEATKELKSYTPPVIGTLAQTEIFTLSIYSTIMTPAGTKKGYECIKYPNCQGEPISVGAEDGVFRVNEYTINSAPDEGQAPYEMTIVTALPVVTA